jgi:hypothetical protein
MKRQSFSFGSIRYGGVLAQDAEASAAKKATTAKNATTTPKKATERVAMLPPFLF